MRRDPGAVLFTVLLSGLVTTAGGQIGPHANSINLGVNAPGCVSDATSEQLARPQAYTAESKTTSVQTLANGTTITRESTEIRAVDSQQRTLNIRTEGPFSEDQPRFTWGNVNDPVENTQITWNSQTRQVQVIKLPPASERHGCWQSDSGQMTMSFGPLHPEEAPRPKIQAIATAVKSRQDFPQPKVEDLGTTTIQGVETRGQRWTTVTPVGQIGNDRELVSTNEVWAAVNLGIPMREVNDSPQGGKTTTEVVRLDLSEPPLSTFQPPEGYEVVIEELHQVTCQGSRTP
jgi:hypothetical protein